MRTTTYCYPWDLARLGVEPTLRRIADDGFDGIDLAATYHPIDSVSPRDGFRLFSDGRGAVYFPARAERYGRIKPRIHSSEIAMAWPAAAGHAARTGLTLNSWTITLFQPWIRDECPDCARVLPGGDASGSGVCPANEDVREFFAALCLDIVEQFGVDLVRLEGVMPHIFDLDWLRARSLVRMSPLVRMLSNLCFCGSCIARGVASGLDVARIRASVNAVICAELADGGNGGDRVEALKADAELTAFAENQVRASIEFVQAIVKRIDGRARVSMNALTPYRALMGDERDEGLLSQFVAACDQVDLNVLNPVGNRLLAGLNARLDRPRPLSALYVTIRNPTVTSAAALAEAGAETIVKSLQAAADVGVRELSLYNYGLLPDADVHAFMEAVGQLRVA
jgi:hypothetical protein